MKSGDRKAASSSGSFKTKVFRDPIHNLIVIGPDDSFILDLTACKEFQRLRRLRQLPGAEHSRFIHSLGVFNFSRRILDQLRRRHSTNRKIVSALRDQERTIKAAALLHDIGHGPFSHVFERVFRELGVKMRKHDEWTCTILRDHNTEVFKCLTEKSKLDVDGVCELIAKSEEPPPEPYLRDIVASQLDADRMDYLLRDSWMTGSQYGRFDSEWILNAMVIGEPVIANRKVKKLCLDGRKGTGAIEGMLMARSLMHQHVYGHRATRAYEAELIQTLRLASEIHEHLPKDTPQALLPMLRTPAKMTTAEYLMLDDDLVWWALRRWAVAKGRGKRIKCLAEHSLRLVRRLKPWSSIDVQGSRITDARERIRELEQKGSELRFECYLDTFEDLPYGEYASVPPKEIVPSLVEFERFSFYAFRDYPAAYAA